MNEIVISLTCYECGNTFDRINEENPTEYRCPKCQADWRIRQANEMHRTSWLDLVKD